MLAGSIRFKNAGEVIRRIAAYDEKPRWRMEKMAATAVAKPAGDLYDTG